ncbi:MAG: TRAP transporter substrate-binding protein [Paracoccaceae bacterium]
MTPYLRKLLSGGALALALAGAAGGGALAEVNLRMASNAIQSTPAKVGDQIAFEWLAEEIEKQTQGEVTLTIYWGGSLGSEASLMGSLESGALDILPKSGSNLAANIPEAGMFSASYLFRDFAHYQAVVTDPAFFERFGAIVASHTDAYRLAGIGATGARNLYNRVHAIATPADGKGLKVRVQSSPIEFQVWQTLGMLPTSIPSTEIYLSLQTGVVDAAESSIPFIMSNKYYEVAPYISLTNHQISTHFFLINNASLEKIPEAHRETVLRLLREAGTRQIEATVELSRAMEAELRALPGVTVTDINVADFEEPLRALQDQVAQDLGVTDLLAMIRAH